MFCTQPVCVAFDAQARQDHGSHVSGIAAGVANTCAPFVGCTMSGVAPKAFLGSYNVFPGNVTDASSADIAMAVDAAVADGMDVLNLSLGGTPTSHDPLVTAVDNAVDAGVIVAIAAGNAGPGPATIEWSGIADKIITIGARTDPTAMAQDGTPNPPTIPAAMVYRHNGLAMASASTTTVSIDGTARQEFFTDGPSADILAGFSSVGPAMIKNQVLREVKPDVVAPGVNVYSSILMTSCAQPPCFAFFQGTSMATPHVAGSAALIKQLHPNWSPEQVKSALENGAKL